MRSSSPCASAVVVLCPCANSSNASCRESRCSIWPATFERALGQIRIDSLRVSWLIFGEGFRQSWRRASIKRLFDILVAASFLLLLSLPVMLVTAILIVLEDGFPVFYRQERVGLDGRLFKVIKFRSMRNDAESDGQPRWATADDDRVTRVGRFIRKVRIDELPQLYSVLDRRHELGRTASGAPVLCRPTDPRYPVLCRAPQRQARRHRLGAGELPLRFNGRRFHPEAAVRSVLCQESLAVP
jgi:hypothetical protein